MSLTSFTAKWGDGVTQVISGTSEEAKQKYKGEWIYATSSLKFIEVMKGNSKGFFC